MTYSIIAHISIGAVIYAINNMLFCSVSFCDAFESIMRSKIGKIALVAFYTIPYNLITIPFQLLLMGVAGIVITVNAKYKGVTVRTSSRMLLDSFKKFVASMHKTN